MYFLFSFLNLVCFDFSWFSSILFFSLIWKNRHKLLFFIFLYAFSQFHNFKTPVDLIAERRGEGGREGGGEGGRAPKTFVDSIWKHKLIFPSLCCQLYWHYQWLHQSATAYVNEGGKVYPTWWQNTEHFFNSANFSLCFLWVSESNFWGSYWNDANQWTCWKASVLLSNHSQSIYYGWHAFVGSICCSLNVP